MGLDFSNTNTAWASVFVETLVRLGVTDAVISPGSRSTPLVIALARHPDVEAIPILDERSAAFFALGLAKRTGTPTVLICTSGTAGANYFPAVIEARESQVPLLLLTADRPPELRDCTSGQTIDQQKLFGDFPNHYAEIALPGADLNRLRYLRQTLAHAYHRTLFPVAGPVHLNCPFRDPLAPIPNDTGQTLAQIFPDDFFTALQSPTLRQVVPGSETRCEQGKSFFLRPAQGNPLFPYPTPTPSIGPGQAQCSRRLIIAGPTQPKHAEEYCRTIATLAHHINAPVLAEGLSPLRNWARLNPHLVTTYDAILRQPSWAKNLVPEQVIQLGPLPTSKVLRQWLEQSDPLRYIVDGTGRNRDPLHGRAVPLSWEDFWLRLSDLSNQSNQSNQSDLTAKGVAPTYLDTWLSLETQYRQQIDHQLWNLELLFEGKVPWLLAQTLPPGTALMIANSMSVRDVEWFWPPNDRGIQPYFNRGANGIDGTLSTALGIAHGSRPTVLLTGDLALLHDTNGFLVGQHFRGHLTIVMINNNGGGIFEMLPVAQFDPPFETYFATPQQVDMAKLCNAYGVHHILVEDWSTLIHHLATLPETGIRLLEVICDGRFPQSMDRKSATAYRRQLLEGLQPISH